MGGNRAGLDMQSWQQMTGGMLGWWSGHEEKANVGETAQDWRRRLDYGNLLGIGWVWTVQGGANCGSMKETFIDSGRNLADDGNDEALQKLQPCCISRCHFAGAVCSWPLTMWVSFMAGHGKEKKSVHPLKSACMSCSSTGASVTCCVLTTRID